ncbi:hypothetical protein BC832DRAFT_432670 [Gaertneriomyces semiglobifer]|nr:hypothetical protein BC832DRAFT_432670 [Gaertneriomyces semiglobifer]
MGAYGHPINDKMVDRMPRPSLDSGKYLGYDGGHHHHHHPSQNSLGQQNAQHSPYESQHSSFDRPYDPTKSMYRDYDDGYSYDYPAVYQQHAFARQRSPSILTTMTVPLERNSEERRAMSVRSLPVGVLESTGAPHPSSSSSSSRHGNTPSNGMSRNGSAGSNGGNGSGGGSTNRLMLPPPTPMLRNPLLKGSQTAAAPPPPSPAAAAGPPATTAPGSSLASTAATGAGGGSYPTHAMGGMGVGDFKQPLFLAHANWTPDVGYRGRGSLEAVVGMGHDRIMTDVGRNSEMGRKSTGDADMSGEDDMDWEEN